MRTFYSLFIGLLQIGFRLSSLFNKKIKKGYHGRKKSLKIIRTAFSQTDSVIWMHAASLGEYEQGLPVLEKLKEKYPNYKVLVSFFSPSGYEHIASKKHPADAICYLPFDTKKNILPLVNAFNPVIFFTVKYDFWYHLLNILHQKGCKNFAISTHFYPQQIFFKPYGKWFTKQLSQTIHTFFHQTEESLRLAKSIGLNHGTLSGDTRFDRVKSFRKRDNTIQYILDFKQNKKLIVFGSAWEGEEEALHHLAEEKNIKIIVAPHDLSRIDALLKKYPDAQRYSTLNTQQAKNCSILLIDSIGLLTKLYSYADIAVVGGGFHNKGLHNILEAATFGIPVLFGNQHKNFPEAHALIQAHGAQNFDTPKALAIFIKKLLNEENTIKTMGENAYQFVSQQPLATEIIYREIQKYLPHPQNTQNSL